MKEKFGHDLRTPGFTAIVYCLSAGFACAGSLPIVQTHIAEKTWIFWHAAVPRMPSDREHGFSQGGESTSYEHVCLMTANSGLGTKVQQAPKGRKAYQGRGVRMNDRVETAREPSMFVGTLR